MEELSTIQRLVVAIPPVLLAITLHEVAHGWMAKRLGDETAARLGRLSLNPLRHIDPVGTVLVPGLMLLLGGVVFGWAKPVPVDTRRLRHPREGMALVAVAGPAANLVMAGVWALAVRFSLDYYSALPWLGVPLFHMGLIGISVNVLLAVLNLLPVPPLDGGRVAVGLLPHRLAFGLSRIEPYGFWIILAGLVSGVLQFVLGILADPVFAVFAAIAGLN